MAVDRRSKRLGMLAVVALLLLGLARHAPVVPPGRAGADYQSDVDQAKTRTVYIPPRAAASSTPTAASSPTTSGSSPSPSTGA
jgi:hypothetical protein